jgi:voltage-gated potassium channel
MTSREPALADQTGAADAPSTRWAVLHDLEDWLEKPILFLGLVWLVLLVVELIRGLPGALEIVATAIWVVFILDFLLRLWLSPDRLTYLRRNWLTALSLLVPALRVFRAFAVVRVARAARATRALQGLTRGGRVVRVVGSINRGMGALRRSMARRGLSFVILLTTVVLLTGAAGMYAFERGAPGGGGGLESFPAALWWTAMLMTTMGSEYWPRSAEGRALCLALGVYAFAMFGYVTASLATFFVGRDAADPNAELAGADDVASLRLEVAALRRDLREFGSRAGGDAGGPPSDATA